MARKAGRPTELTDATYLKIRQGVLDGKLYKEILEELQISRNTWDTWVNKDYKDFRAKLVEWKRERMFNKSEIVLENIIDFYDNTAPYMRLKLDAAKHITETIGRDIYSKKSEVKNTGTLTHTIVTDLPDDELDRLAAAGEE